MSEERRKNARTQNRFSDGNKEYISRRQDKLSLKIPSTDKNKGIYNTCEKKSPIVGSRAQTKTDLQFEEDSNYSFKHLEPVKKPQKIWFAEPILQLSNTINGISRLIYLPDFMKLSEADNYFNILLHSTAWHDKNIVIKGVEYPQPRLVAWYGPHPYTYAGATLEAKEMSCAVREIKEKVEAILRQFDIKVELNSVLLNLYRNEKDSVAWHSDDELSLGVCPTIASVSLGATRRFEIRPKEHVRSLDTGDILFVNLTNGSLIVMDGCMQKDWQHRVPKEYHDREQRINLTFRTIFPFNTLPPEMPHVSNMKSVKSPSEKLLNHQDPKFDSESFPPLGMEAIDKKTKSLPKQNGKKDYKPFVQKKSPKRYCQANGEKPKRNNDKVYQKYVEPKKYQKEEKWDNEMPKSYEATPAIQNNQKSSSDLIIDSPELHLNQIEREEYWDEFLENVENKPTIQNSQKSSCDKIINTPEYSSDIDCNLNLKTSTKLCNNKFSFNDFSKCDGYSDSCKTYQLQNDEPTNSHFCESEDSNLSEQRSFDFNSTAEKFEKSGAKSELESDSFKAYQSHEPTDSHLLKSNDPCPSERKPFKVKSELLEIDVNISDSGKVSMLNANAPDFIPQNKFENLSLSQLAERGYYLKTEDFLLFANAIFVHLYSDDQPLLPRDFYELDVYYELIKDGLLSDKHLKIILERICSMTKHAYNRINEPRYTNRPPRRSYDDNNHYKCKQFYGKSQRY